MIQSEINRETTEASTRFQSHEIISLDLESFIAPDHWLRKTYQQIELSFIRRLTAHHYCLNNGRPSIDPEIFFRIMLIGYLYNILSDRSLCEQIKYNLAYR